MATIEKEIAIGPAYANRQKLFQEESVRGTLSPYDIPSKVVIRFDALSRSLSIDFKYLTPNEPKEPVETIDDVSLETGKLSGKLYAVEVRNVSKHGMTAALADVQSALNHARTKYRITRPLDQAPFLNLSFAQDLLSFIQDGLKSLELADDI